MAQLLLRLRRSPRLSSSPFVAGDLRNHRIPSLSRHFTLCLSSDITRYKNTHHQTLAKVERSYEEAKKGMYVFSTEMPQGFKCLVTREMSEKFKGLPRVVCVSPDTCGDTVENEHGGERYQYEVIKAGASSVQYDRGRHGESGFEGNNLRASIKNQQVNPRYSNKAPNHGKVRDSFQLENLQSKPNNSPLIVGDMGYPFPHIPLDAGVRRIHRGTDGKRDMQRDYINNARKSDDRGNAEHQNPFPQSPYIRLDTVDRRNHQGTYGKRYMQRDHVNNAPKNGDRGNVEHQNPFPNIPLDAGDRRNYQCTNGTRDMQRGYMNNTPKSGDRGNVEHQNPFPQSPYIPLDTGNRRNHQGIHGKRDMQRDYVNSGPKSGDRGNVDGQNPFPQIPFDAGDRRNHQGTYGKRDMQRDYMNNAPKSGDRGSVEHQNPFPQSPYIPLDSRRNHKGTYGKRYMPRDYMNNAPKSGDRGNVEHQIPYAQPMNYASTDANRRNFEHHSPFTEPDHVAVVAGDITVSREIKNTSRGPDLLPMYEGTNEQGNTAQGQKDDMLRGQVNIMLKQRDHSISGNRDTPRDKISRTPRSVDRRNFEYHNASTLLNHGSLIAGDRRGTVPMNSMQVGEDLFTKYEGTHNHRNSVNLEKSCVEEEQGGNIPTEKRELRGSTINSADVNVETRNRGGPVPISNEQQRHLGHHGVSYKPMSGEKSNITDMDNASEGISLLRKHQGRERQGYNSSYRGSTWQEQRDMHPKHGDHRSDSTYAPLSDCRKDPSLKSNASGSIDPIPQRNYTYVKYVPSGGSFPEHKRGDDNSYSGIGEEHGVPEVDEKVFLSKWIVQGQNKNGRRANVV